MDGFDIPARRPFFETLVELIIGVLFVSIPATVAPASLSHLVLPTLGLVAVPVLITRPLVAPLATLRTDLTRGTCIHQVDGPARHRRGGHRVDVCRRS